jgi:hypothetical protein
LHAILTSGNAFVSTPGVNGAVIGQTSSMSGGIDESGIYTVETNTACKVEMQVNALAQWKGGRRVPNVVKAGLRQMGALQDSIEVPDHPKCPDERCYPSADRSRRSPLYRPYGHPRASWFIDPTIAVPGTDALQLSSGAGNGWYNLARPSKTEGRV